MRIWIIKTGEPLPIDAEHPRLLRSGLLASELANRGHEVTWWSSSFNHAQKRQRNHPTDWVQLGPSHKLRLIPSPGYQRNVSAQRLWDHHLTARRFLRIASKETRPDLIFCALPTLELSLAAAKISKGWEIPLVTDVRDLWPDIFYDAIPTKARAVANFALSPFRRMARDVCRASTAITGNAESFVEWGVKLAERPRTEHDRYFAHGYHQPEFSFEVNSEAQDFWRKRGITPRSDEIRVTYVGALGRHVDFAPAIEAIRSLTQDVPARLIICGEGDQSAALRKVAEEFKAIDLPGWVDAPEIKALLSMTTVAVAPYVPCPNYQENLPNKIIEYAANGAPVAVSLDESEMHRLVRDHNFGDSYGCNARRLADLLSKLHNKPANREQMSVNAERLFLSRYEATRVYEQLADHLEQIVSATSRTNLHQAA